MPRQPADKLTVTALMPLDESPRTGRPWPGGYSNNSDGFRITIVSSSLAIPFSKHTIKHYEHL